MVDHNGGEMNRPSPLVFFSIGAMVDFVFGLVKWHSILAGTIAIVCGVTGLLFLGFRESWRGNDD
jgi:Na+-transporting methylmalonyl-CoA/oxaloacetate decarboxylase beta subunit